MTATRGDRVARCRVSGKAGRLDIDYKDSGATLKFINCHGMDELQAMQFQSDFEAANLQSTNWRPGNKELTIVLKGTANEIAQITRLAFRKAFNVGARRAVQFSIDAQMNDERLLRKNWTELDELETLPDAKTSGESLIALEQGEARGRHIIFSILIAPFPFLIAYHFWDFRTAVWVWLLTSLLILARWWRLRDKTKKPTLFTYLMSLTPILYVLTLMTDNIHYMLSIPSMQCACWFVSFSLQIAKGKSPFAEPTYKLATRRALNVVPLVLFIAGIAMNEYLRSVGNLNVWVWYFAYLRLELFVGFMATIIPVLSMFEFDNKAPQEN